MHPTGSCSGFDGITCTDKDLWGVWGFGGCSTAIWPLPNLGLAKYLATLPLSIFSELLGTFLSLYPFNVVNLALADRPGNCLT